MTLTAPRTQASQPASSCRSVRSESNSAAAPGLAAAAGQGSRLVLLARRMPAAASPDSRLYLQLTHITNRARPDYLHCLDLRPDQPPQRCLCLLGGCTPRHVCASPGGTHAAATPSCACPLACLPCRPRPPKGALQQRSVSSEAKRYVRRFLATVGSCCVVDGIQHVAMCESAGQTEGRTHPVAATQQIQTWVLARPAAAQQAAADGCRSAQPTTWD